jgi:hypothetical protein
MYSNQITLDGVVDGEREALGQAAVASVDNMIYPGI